MVTVRTEKRVVKLPFECAALKIQEAQCFVPKFALVHLNLCKTVRSVIDRIPVKITEIINI